MQSIASSQRSPTIDMKPAYENKDFIKAAMFLEIEKMREILEHSKIDINAADLRGKTALYFACLMYVGENREQAKEVVLFLLEKGANPNAPNTEGRVPLNVAALQEDLEVAELLLNKGADPNMTNPEGNTLLHIAARKNHLKVAELLLSKGADPNILNAEGDSPLYVAAKENCLETAELLISKGADIHLTKGVGEQIGPFKGYTALHIAAYKGHLKMVELLLSKGADPDLPNEKGEIPLHIVFETPNRDDRVAQLLLKKTQNFHSTDRYGCIPLHNAAIFGGIAAFEILLAATPDPDAPNRAGRIPLHCVAFSKSAPAQSQVEKIKLLVKKTKHLNSLDGKENGETPLHIAAKDGYLEVCEALVEGGADPRNLSTKRETPYELAARQGKVKNAAFLKIAALRAEAMELIEDVSIPKEVMRIVTSFMDLPLEESNS